MISVEQQVVRSAIDMLKPRGAWIQKCSARVSDGRECATLDPQASKFCMGAAIGRACVLKDVIICWKLRRKFIELNGADFVTFNDASKRRKRDVILALERLYDAL